MSGLSFGDLAQSYAMKSRIGALKGQTTRLSTELATGKKSDIAAAVSGDVRGLAAIDRSRQLLGSHIAVAQEAGIRSEARRNALATVVHATGGVSTALAAMARDSSPDQLKRIADEARSAFSESVRALNAQIAGRPLFAGMAASGAAIAPAEDMLSALEPFVAGLTDPAAIATAVASWFEDPAGYAATGYVGQPPGLAVGLGEAAGDVPDRTANEPQIRKALAGLALAAMIDRSELTGSGPERMEIKARAFDALRQGIDAVNDFAARIGADEARISATVSRHQAEVLTLELAMAELTSADPARTAVELQAVQTNLETVYAVTARLSRMSLAGYLG